ncbi:MAG: hypothetical protein COV55_00050 [Candidatus Komeilibacteria bacterium CG11_big_fil_rev_8_21_14_0_20_36_20]|uniref:DUF5667 domain-containing protein n=1 Tax=Candidatus Komeilibacteria bacterium CG11_big_fil_rev_8_21_14_0_20_36_20 TaxID=1974477 RepID=A0A2H0NEP4_9BACT|nr:MAG: hypothetical protein COV55_00050 [Candidatus Komeilibacteria bacterium CG11_big_fil_rev_8_21_14_0_20_36_20]PIR81189.1 MAG: hypothetical protein COU21_04960 [Candidatus Komeilibacteria bacterium CG10_big_fil_rev_8_21_14_0_10_36_65]PJC55751.1 MAG: hypothetical protein CO027_00315 [Candidatus Komeilibacteria bacterium CG_4_9_14_0_2_um_filter_36_13]
MKKLFTTLVIVALAMIVVNVANAATYYYGYGYGNDSTLAEWKKEKDAAQAVNSSQFIVWQSDTCDWVDVRDAIDAKEDLSKDEQGVFNNMKLYSKLRLMKELAKERRWKISAAKKAAEEAKEQGELIVKYFQVEFTTAYDSLDALRKAGGLNRNQFNIEVKKLRQEFSHKAEQAEIAVVAEANEIVFVDPEDFERLFESVQNLREDLKNLRDDHDQLRHEFNRHVSAKKKSAHPNW